MNRKKVRGQNTGSLSYQTAQALRKRIKEGPIQVGEKLPTEKVMAAEFGVSRTVIREAIIALRADGLLEAKHGVGYFVSNVNTESVQQTKTFDFLQSPNISPLDILEFRMAVEIHAAGLAATRRSWAQEERIWSCAKKFEETLEANEATEEADRAFHRSISEATNNQAFLDFFDQLGALLLPRNSITSKGGGKIITRSYLEKSISEHNAVCQAISSGDAEAARNAMQAHLSKSQRLYRGLATAKGTQ